MKNEIGKAKNNKATIHSVSGMKNQRDLQKGCKILKLVNSTAHVPYHVLYNHSLQIHNYHKHAESKMIPPLRTIIVIVALTW